jgi:hypothetical protein
MVETEVTPHRFPRRSRDEQNRRPLFHIARRVADHAFPSFAAFTPVEDLAGVQSEGEVEVTGERNRDQMLGEIVGRPIALRIDTLNLATRLLPATAAGGVHFTK